MQYAAGETLCKEAEFNNTLFIVKKGSIVGTSLQSNKKNIYGPGSIIGEFSLVENAPCPETLTAQEDSEVQAISGDTFQETLKQEPPWVDSIINFLSKRAHIAESDFQKNQKIKSLPALLCILHNISKDESEKEIPLSLINEKMDSLVSLPNGLVKELLKTMEELELLKLQTNSIKNRNIKVIELLYKSILHRAVKKEPSPNILSITEQMVLTAVIKTVQESSEPLQNGKSVVATSKLIATARKTTHGMTLTMRNMQTLLEKGVLQCDLEIAPDFSTELESINAFYGDFDFILDLMELNRVYPLLDKKLL